MGAPIHTPEMRGATMHAFGVYEDTYRGTEVVSEPASVREWRTGRRDRIQHHGWFAFRRTTAGGIQIAYAGSHPADIPRKLWREWFGPVPEELELWNAARRELRLTNHPPSPEHPSSR